MSTANASAPVGRPSRPAETEPADEGSVPPTVSTALGATLATAAVGASSTAAGAFGSVLSAWWRRLLVAVGYSRHGDADPLTDDRRERVYEAVRASPGVPQSTLAERTDVPLSSLRHHLDVLADEDLVVSVRSEGRRRYFPAEMADPSGAVGADVGPVASAVLAAVSRLEPATGAELAEALDRDPSTVSHHLDKLADAGLVERQRTGRAVANRLTSTAEQALSESPFPADAATGDD